EIKADVSGIITEICIKNGQPAAGGQALFKIKKT
ncbi:MAG TPA: acetyl-CoA carboxylase, biotin carboxyl carrier protein, partial [Spirochaetia bacterium]|nr:acetyl-CoA carboxylase, biotin carboxyl carrier protein [Spirochaetia bacterium]